MTTETEFQAERQARWEFTLVEKSVCAAMIGLMGWMAVTVQQVSLDVAVMKSQIESATADRFTADQGSRLEDRIHRNEQRIEAIEQRMRR